MIKNHVSRPIDLKRRGSLLIQNFRFNFIIFKEKPKKIMKDKDIK